MIVVPALLLSVFVGVEAVYVVDKAATLRQTFKYAKEPLGEQGLFALDPKFLADVVNKKNQEAGRGQHRGLQCSSTTCDTLASGTQRCFTNDCCGARDIFDCTCSVTIGGRTCSSCRVCSSDGDIVTDCTNVACGECSETSCSGNCIAPPCRQEAPSNNLCSDALSISRARSGTTDGADVESRFPACGGETFTAPVVWYHTSGTGGTMTANTCSSNTDFDTKLTIFRGSSCSALSCVAANDDSTSCSSGTRSSVSWSSSSGTRYYIAVHGYESETGDFTLQISSASSPNPPTSSPRSSPNPPPTSPPTRSGESPTTPREPSTTTESKSLSAGIIGGIVAGCVLGIMAIAGSIIGCVVCKNRQGRKQALASKPVIELSNTRDEEDEPDIRIAPGGIPGSGHSYKSGDPTQDSSGSRGSSHPPTAQVTRYDNASVSSGVTGNTSPSRRQERLLKEEVTVHPDGSKTVKQTFG